VIDEREQRVCGPILDSLPVIRVEVDLDQVDERPVLLVGNAAAVEEVPFVDAGLGRDPA
jgi:hypothetical protein